MKIGVVADTHSQDLPKKLLEGLKGADLIIHAGDFCSLQDAQQFEKLSELKAVFGNMDDEKIRKKYPKRQIIECAGKKIGVTHGEGAPHFVVDGVRHEFKKDKVDVIIFGHTHQPMNEIIDGVLLFNPGSPNDTVYAPYCSFGLLEIENGMIRSKIVKVTKDG